MSESLTPPPLRRVPVIGVIGGIGAGKSLVAAALAARGGPVIDADRLGHEALEVPAIREQILARWGSQGNLLRPDGRIDRRALGRIVFANPDELRALERLVFPEIKRRILEELTRWQSAGVPFIVLDAAVMLEAGWSERCDRLVYVDAPRSLRLARLASRSGWTEADLAAREQAQWPEEVKKRHAHAIIVNDGTGEELQRQVDQLLRRWHLLRMGGEREASESSASQG